jgi:hypothetical protein
MATAADVMKATTRTNLPDEDSQNDHEVHLRDALAHIQAANDTARPAELSHLEQAAKFVQSAQAAHNKPMSPGEKVSKQAKENSAKYRV